MKHAFHMNVMLLNNLFTKALYCCQQNESFADLNEDNEY